MLDGRTVLLLCLMGLAGNVTAAPPKLTHLFPAGVQRGVETSVMCHGEFSWPIQVRAQGANVSISEEKGKLNVYVPKDMPTDRIWIRVYNPDGASAAIPLMIGSLPEVSEKEPNDKPSSAQRIDSLASAPRDSESTINGVLQKNGDVDAFAIDLEKGQTLVAAVQANSAFGSPMDAVLQIVSRKGTLLAENHDAVGLDPRISFKAPRKDEYVVRVFAFPAAPNQRIQFHGGKDYVYRLILTTGPFITHAIPMSATYDRDNGFTPNTIELLGWNIPEGTRAPLRTILKRDDGQQLEVSSPDAEIGFVRVPGWSGTVRIGASTGSVLPGLASTDRAEPRELLIPQSATGLIASPGAKDYFQFSLEKDQHISIHVDAMKLNSPLVAFAQLIGPDEKVVAESSESGKAKDVILNHRAKQSGSYQLVIRDRFQHGSGRHFYRVTTKNRKSDFQLSLEEETVVVEAGKPTELSVKISREAGTGPSIGEIAITALDLPTGVTVQSITSKPKGETAKKITLKLKADVGTEFNGPIRIQGQDVATKATRLATTPVPPVRFRATFDRVWLTVKPQADPEESE